MMDVLIGKVMDDAVVRPRVSSKITERADARCQSAQISFLKSPFLDVEITEITELLSSSDFRGSSGVLALNTFSGSSPPQLRFFHFVTSRCSNKIELGSETRVGIRSAQTQS